MDLRLDGKRVLVTGGSRGIGRETALAFARSGALVATCYHSSRPDAETLARELKGLGDEHRVVRADLTVPSDVTELIGVCRDAFGGLDVVVNNAGVDGQASLEDLSAAEWARVLDLNLTGCHLVTQAALPLLGDGASVINLGASVALRGRPGSAHYTASKAAVAGLSRSQARELGPRGIRVNIVAPGVIISGPDDGPPQALAGRIRAMTALGRLGTPAEVASAVLFLASDLARYISGATLNVDGGI